MKKNKKKLKLIVMVITLLFVVLNILMHTQSDIKKEKYDYILILGTQLDGKDPSSMLEKRIQQGYIDYTAGLAEKIIASGSQATNEVISEAEVIKNRLVKMGVPESDILIEDQSTRTVENIEYSFKKVGKNKTMLVVSNYYHLLRVNMIADYLGVEVDTDGAKTPSEFAMKYYFREYAALGKFTLEMVGLING